MSATKAKTYNLLPNESTKMALQQAGVQLLTIYNCKKNDFNNQKYEKLKRKCEAIFIDNDFLMGTITFEKGRVHLRVHEEKAKSENFVKEHVVDKKLFKKETSYEEKSEILSKFKVPNGETIMKQNSNLGEIYLLRDHEDVDQSDKLAIILSVNHIIADGRTIYNIFNMLDDNTEVRSLDRNATEFNDKLYECTNLAGKNGKNLLLNQGIMDLLPWLAKSYSRSGKSQYDVKLYNFRVNGNEVDKIKQKYLDPAKGQFVSTNDVLTSQLFQKNPKADFVQMAIDVRSRLQKNSDGSPTGIHLDKAGNYVATMYMRKSDVSSALNVRKCLNARLAKSNDKKLDHQEKPPYKVQRSYPVAVTTNWATFYKSVKIDGLELELQLPFFDASSLSMRFLGIQVSWEDSLIIFKCNDTDTGVYIITGSNKISKEDLEKDDMFGERLI